MLNNIVKKGESYYIIMSSIATLFKTNLYSRDRNIKFKDEYKIYSSYIVMVTNREALKLVIQYFDKYPLLSSKYLDYKDWAHIVKIIESKGQKFETYKLAEEIRNNYNQTRHQFKWDHLKLFND